jgi:transposase InsO family protein
MCGLFGYSRQAYYAQLRDKVYRSFDQDAIILLVLQRRKLLPRCGTDQLIVMLKEDFIRMGIKIGRDAMIKLLRKYNLLIRPKKKRKCITTLSDHPFYKYPNIIKDLTANHPNHIWVSDITFLWMEGEGCFAHVMLITDVYSRYVVGYHVSRDMTAESIVKGLDMALQNTTEEQRKYLIHHSDRGMQYCSRLYINRLGTGIKISMTENGDPLENAIAERINRTIKDDFTVERQMEVNCLEEAEEKIKESIRIYNHIRPHSSISYLTPAVAYQGKHELKRMWKSYYKKKQNEVAGADGGIAQA